MLYNIVFNKTVGQMDIFSMKTLYIHKAVADLAFAFRLLLIRSHPSKHSSLYAINNKYIYVVIFKSSDPIMYFDASRTHARLSFNFHVRRYKYTVTNAAIYKVNKVSSNEMITGELSVGKRGEEA